MPYDVSSAGGGRCLQFDRTMVRTSLERELKEAIQELDQSKIAEVLVQKGMKWIFNTHAASHQGGVWERQILTVRKIFNSVLNQQILDDEGLHTVLCEVEAIINDRPITKASDDPNDLEPLTPNHLLLMKKTTSHATGSFCERGMLFSPKMETNSIHDRPFLVKMD